MNYTGLGYGFIVGLMVGLSNQFMNFTPIHAVVLGLVFGLMMAIIKFVMIILNNKFKEYKIKRS